MAKAAPKLNPEININLLPNQGSTGAIGNAVVWMLSVGRYLVIFTEIVAIAIFVVSIVLSSEKTSLREEIRSLSQQVSAQSSFEKHFRQISGQITQIKNLSSNQFLTNKVVDELLNLLPQGVSLDSLILKGDQLTLDGSFSSPSQLQTLVASFAKSTKLVGLSLTKLNAPDDKNPNFTFSGVVSINKNVFLRIGQ